jgi:hypothetical protein
MAVLVMGTAKLSYAFSFSDDFVVNVGDRFNPSDFDPLL